MIVFIYVGFFHLHFYIKKIKKIILNIMQSSEKNSKFFKDQTKDNMIGFS